MQNSQQNKIKVVELVLPNIQPKYTTFLLIYTTFLIFYTTFEQIYTTFCPQMYYFYTKIFSKYPKKVQLNRKKSTTKVLKIYKNNLNAKSLFSHFLSTHENLQSTLVDYFSNSCQKRFSECFITGCIFR